MQSSARLRMWVFIGWCCTGLIFAGMAVISLVGVMPAAFVADHLGRKWTIVPSCLGLALSLIAMAMTGEQTSCSAASCQAQSARICGVRVDDVRGCLQAAWRPSCSQLPCMRSAMHAWGLPRRPTRRT